MAAAAGKVGATYGVDAVVEAVAVVSHRYVGVLLLDAYLLSASLLLIAQVHFDFVFTFS